MTTTNPRHANIDSTDTPIALSASQMRKLNKWADYIASEIDDFIEYDPHLEDEEQHESGYQQSIEMHKYLMNRITAELKLN